VVFFAVRLQTGGERLDYSLKATGFGRCQHMQDAHRVNKCSPSPPSRRPTWRIAPFHVGAQLTGPV
jgi:hypothetical protein